MQDFNRKVENWRKGIYKLVVVGEIKKGKSSFVNALLGEANLTPVAAEIASAIPIKIIYGEFLRIQVHFLGEGSEESAAPIDIDISEIDKYATETGVGEGVFQYDAGNKNNQYNVNYISIEYPSDLLKEGLVIVDLPGLGGVYKHHTRLVQEYLNPRRADHIIFVMDSTGHPLSSEEADTIRDLKERNMDRFLFVQTKKDAASIEQVKIYEEKNKSHISKILGIDKADLTNYFIVSSHQKLHYVNTDEEKYLKRSGFPLLEEYLLNTLIPQKKDLLGEVVAIEMSDMLDQIKSDVILKLEIRRAEGAEALRELKSYVNQHYSQIKAWETKVLPCVREKLDERVDKASRKFLRRIDSRLHPNKLVGEKLHSIEGRNLSAKEIGENAESLFSAIKDEALTIVQEEVDDLVWDCDSAWEEAAIALNDSAPEISFQSKSFSPDSEVTVRSVHQRTSPVRTFGQVFRGVSMGTFVAGGVVAAISAIAAVPATILTGIGVAIWGTFGWLAGKEVRQDKAQQALARLRNEISSAYAQMREEIRTQSREYSQGLKEKAREQLSEAVQARISENNRQKAELRDKESQTREEQQRRIRELESYYNHIEGMRGALQSAMRL